MIAIAMFIAGGVLMLLAAILRFEPKAAVLTSYSAASPVQIAAKNRWASRPVFALAVLSFACGMVVMNYPALLFWLAAAWIASLFTVSIYVAVK